jgi:signal transduction histidine kinase
MAQGGFTRRRAALGIRREFTRIASLLRSRLAGLRVLFAAAVVLVVSTQIFFQPLLYDPFAWSYVLQRWLDYLGECLLMGGSILLLVSIAQKAVRPVRGAAAAALLGGAVAAGSIAGRLLLIPYYGMGWDDPFDRVFWGDVVYWMTIAGGAVTIYALQQRTAAAAATLHEVEVDRLALSKQILEARLQLMRAQIEPHFLFNTLANVKRLCQTDASGGLAMLENLVRYLRAALPRMRDAQTTLGQEADLVVAYLAVLKIRMGNRLRYSIDVPPALRARPFPPMMLLTLTENAIKHGLGPSERGGTITIRAGSVGGMLEVVVADDGVGFDALAAGGTGIGLANTRARLLALHGESARLDLGTNLPSGGIATIRVPLDAPPAAPVAVVAAGESPA